MTHTLKVGCYGAKGSYTYEAMEQQFAGKEREESYFPLFEDVVKAVKDGTIDYGVLPIENSSTGGITEASAPEWLAFEPVLCVGGSWVTGGTMAEVEAKARAAAGLRD